MLKKLLVILLALTLILSVLTGCSEKGEDTEELPETDTEPAPESDEPVLSKTAKGYSAGLDSNGHFEGINASELVTLPLYKGVSVPESVFVASEDAVKEQIDYILQSSEEYEHLTDKAIEDGDTVNIDYVGSIDGVEFQGGSTGGAGTDVTIGVTQYIDDFLEQLIGHKPGENFDIEVTFPVPYQNNPDLAGKDAVFNITVNYIQGDPITPELNDELAASYNFDSVEDLLADIEKWIIEEQKADFINTILDSAECSEVPASVKKHFISVETTMRQRTADSYDVDLDTIAMYMLGYPTFDDYLSAKDGEFTVTAARALVMQAIAEKEGIAPTEEDLIAAGSEEYAETYGYPYLNWYVLTETLIPQFIFDNAAAE